MTVRQVFYRAVAAGLIDKTETEYKRTVVRLLSDMRRDQELPYHWLADSTRWMRKPSSYSGMDEFLATFAASYRRNLWATKDTYVEVWLEKEALAGVLYGVTAQWDVPLMVTRGYPSLSYLHAAAEEISTKGWTHIYYFGDHDPSGVDISRKVEQDLRSFADPRAGITFERVAVNPDQIEAWDLPTRPTKKKDPRSAGFEGESVEVDSIPPAALRELAEGCITRYVDHRELEVTRRIEAEERDGLMKLVGIGLDGSGWSEGWKDGDVL